MKITDLRLDGFNNVAKRDGSGNVELFYVIEMNTIRVKYVEATGEVLSLVVNGREMNLNDKEMISQLNVALGKAKTDMIAKAIGVKITDLHLDGFNAIEKMPDEEGIGELFYMIGMNTVRVRYNVNKKNIIALEVNGDPVDFRDPEILANLNANLDAAKSSYTRRQEENKKIRLSDLHLDGFNAIEKMPDGEGIGELFYMIGMNTVRVKYNVNTEMVVALEVNGEDIDLNNDQVIQEFNDALDEARRKLGGIVY